MKWKSLNHVWLFATPWTVTLPGSFVHGLLQAKILEWVVVPFSRGSSQPRKQIQAFRIAGGFFTVWGPGKAHEGIADVENQIQHASLFLKAQLLSSKRWSAKKSSQKGGGGGEELNRDQKCIHKSSNIFFFSQKFSKCFWLPLIKNYLAVRSFQGNLFIFQCPWEGFFLGNKAHKNISLTNRPLPALRAISFSTLEHMLYVECCHWILETTLE